MFDFAVTFFKQAFATRLSILCTLGTLLMCVTFFLHFLSTAETGGGFAFCFGSLMVAVAAVAPLFCALYPPSSSRSHGRSAAEERAWLFVLVSIAGWSWLASNLAHESWSLVFSITLNSYLLLVGVRLSSSAVSSLYAAVAGGAAVAFVSQAPLLLYV